MATRRLGITTVHHHREIKHYIYDDGSHELRLGPYWSGRVSYDAIAYLEHLGTTYIAMTEAHPTPGVFRLAPRKLEAIAEPCIDCDRHVRMIPPLRPRLGGPRFPKPSDFEPGTCFRCALKDQAPVREQTP